MRGKDQAFYPRKSPPMDHPRLCGEKWHKTVLSAQNSGSPPPMRGKEMPDYWRSAAAGITPAYAGKRPPLSWHL